MLRGILLYLSNDERSTSDWPLCFVPRTPRQTDPDFGGWSAGYSQEAEEWDAFGGRPAEC